MAAIPKTLNLSVTGMTCGSCVRHVSDALGQLGGVEEAEVSLEQRRARITYDPDRVTPEQLVGAVQEAGYVARIRESRSRSALPVRSGCGSSCCA